MLFFGLGFGPRAEGWGAGFRIESYCTSWRVSIRFEDVSPHSVFFMEERLGLGLLRLSGFRPKLQRCHEECYGFELAPQGQDST